MPDKKTKVYDLTKIEEIRKEINATLPEDQQVYWTGMLVPDGAYDLLGVQKITLQPILNDREMLWDDLTEIHRVINKELPQAFEVFRQRIDKEALVATITAEELEKHRTK